MPFEPTAFPSGARTHLLYELHVTNTGSVTIALQSIDVVDNASNKTLKRLATTRALESILVPTGSIPQDEGVAGPLVLRARQRAVAFMEVDLGSESPLPETLRHHIVAGGLTADGAVIGTHSTPLHVLGPPLQGTHWRAFDGPGNGEENHHRRGILTINGREVISRRYAIDWKQVHGDVTFSGDPAVNQSYFAYGQPVLAVANGRVVTARDGMPDNVPRHDGATFRPSMPITLETAAGNTITLDLGGGQFAFYCHLLPGSVRVQAGDEVRQGTVLARVGNSGDAREPHLHFEVTTHPEFVAGEGVPYLIDHFFIIAGADHITGRRTRELPMNDVIVDFDSGTTP